MYIAHTMIFRDMWVRNVCGNSNDELLCIVVISKIDMGVITIMKRVIYSIIVGLVTDQVMQCK